MKDSRQITQGALMIGIYLIVLLMNIFIPYIGIVLFFALPLPFIVYSYRHGLKPGLIMLVAATILGSLFGTVFSLPLTLMVGIGGLCIGTALHRKRSPYETWAIGSVGFIIGLVLVFLLTQVLFGVNWIEEVKTMMDESFMITENIMQQMPGDTEEVGQQIDAMKEQINRFPIYLPSIFALMGIFFALISQWVGYKAINRLENKRLGFTKFRNFQLPVSLLWYYFIAMLLEMATNNQQDGTLYLAATNVFTLTGVLIALQGIAFLFYYVHAKGKSKALPITAIVLTVLIPDLGLYLVRILGIIDIGFSLRNRLKETK
ncbi:YybS family protein [Thalassobacillus hwangdonensis]|uniref:YybS family protein n=1 Tax=Thalassobacillus hwangdonensis TaxID=546108 RepID=A0ABW3L231_9BACI